MKKLWCIIALLILISSFYSCKKCYTCQARKVGIDKMIDFEKSCDESEFQIMEDSFRAEYPDTLGYYIFCN